MSNLNRFLKGNKKVRKNVRFAATKSLCDEQGKPLEWELKPLTTRENDVLRDDCTTEIPIPGKPGQYRSRFDATKYLARMICACVVYPDLYNAELQDSYGVKTPEALITEMIDNPTEYNALAEFIQKENGLDATLSEKIDAAKN